MDDREQEKNLRRGYTTGSTATAAAKAAVKMLVEQEEFNHIKIATPAGIDLDLEVIATKVTDEYAQAAVIKDAGDDPDITDGVKIIAKVVPYKSGIKLVGGLGVGQVTKPGLAVEVGQAAINPTPRKMINSAVNKVLPANQGVEVTIEVPAGEELAKQTLNPKLGIKGGISILGTTGIVEPMSEQAYKDSLKLAIDQAVAVGYQKIVLVFGNYGKNLAQELGFATEQIVRMSNFVGYMLDHSVSQAVTEVVLIGHIGKLAKVAAGIFNTHSQIADARLETMAAYSALQGASQGLIQDILTANTAQAAVEIIKQAGQKEVFNLLAKRVAIRAKEYTDDKLEVKSILFTKKIEIIGRYGVFSAK